MPLAFKRAARNKVKWFELHRTGASFYFYNAVATAANCEMKSRDVLRKGYKYVLEEFDNATVTLFFFLRVGGGA